MSKELGKKALANFSITAASGIIAAVNPAIGLLVNAMASTLFYQWDKQSDGVVSNVLEGRVLKLLDKLDKEFSKLSEDAVTKEFFKTEEGFDLFASILEKSTKTRQDEKLDYYCKILREAATEDSYKTVQFDKQNSYEHLVNAIAQLLENDIIVLGVFLKEGRENNKGLLYLYFNEDEVIQNYASFSALENAGLITRNNPNPLSQRVVNSGLVPTSFSVTPLGMKLKAIAFDEDLAMP